MAYIVQDAGMRVMVTRQKLELDAALQECGCGPLKQLDSRICVSLLTGVMKI